MTPTPMIWATPTPYPTPVGTAVLANLFTARPEIALAEQAVQGYQFVNQNGAMEYVYLAVILFLIFGGIWYLIGVMQRDF